MGWRPCTQVSSRTSRVGDWAPGGGFSPCSFRAFVSGLRALVKLVGVEAFVRAVEAQDEVVAADEREGRRLRFRDVSAKDWLTPFGRASIADGPKYPKRRPRVIASESAGEMVAQASRGRWASAEVGRVVLHGEEQFGSRFVAQPSDADR